MAQKAAKTLAARNTQILNRTLSVSLAVHAFYLLVRLILFRASFTRNSFITYLLLWLPAAFIQFQFERIGRPTYVSGAAGERKELKKSGDDLEAKGLTEWMWDVLYWTYGCTILVAVLGDWAWWWWVVIPLYSGWLAYTTFMGAKGGMAGMTDSAGVPQGGASKRSQKLEKRGGQKMQYR
ncbi:DUF788 domain protein [Mytilinidion resinicola]|uniref:DUF788 domain protein n=1 Tax=Mytilinidion resinicola TaxID=574789 RepID=A0A6A6YE50_9PEZI|nr:DUF788 domain protein [Mytilinidion resinicola]KAF2807102.1 DUF788 domain protein [Mytilinidion resinicola]